MRLPGASHLRAAVALLPADAVPALAELGFRCGDSCHRPSDDQTLHLRTAGDRIAEVTFDLPEDPAAGRWATEHLPFPTPEVEPAVRAVLARSHGEGRPFAGVVAGTVLVVDTPRPWSQGATPSPGSP
ncbi:hypothetical protein JOD57_004002 [Geodermatophilus bullaregiensis]|uniref:hypothetical protein n=1 Tax=Geodermatophilus bullaregiensis TaxID=1564160 RepID=UPI00195D3109|nr:hypothetical protein [Geodermatophilus bullaregiensis]MBM7808165.1 hypothetical protein [Geodermatophilus bullaregiensis]